MQLRRFFLVIGALAALCPALSAQRKARQDSLVTLISAKSASLLEMNGQDYRKVVGPARFLHNNTYLLCDTALWNVTTNVIFAEGHVQIIQDRTKLSSATLEYIVDEDLAKFRGGVVQLEDKDKNILRTHYLDYNTKDSVAIFQNGASMRDKDGQIIESRFGSYDSKAKTFQFMDDVNMFTDSLFIKTSSLEYHSDINTAYFGYATDAWEHDNMLSADDGWYDRDKELIFFHRNVHLLTKDNEAWSDSLYYQRDTRDLEMLGEVEVMDTTQNVYGLAGRLQYTDTLSQIHMTRDPAIMSISEERHRRDTLYFGADTLLYRTIPMCDIHPAWLKDANKRLADLRVDPVTEYRRKAAEEARKREEEAKKNDPNAPPENAADAEKEKAAAQPVEEKKEAPAKPSKVPGGRGRRGLPQQPADSLARAALPDSLAAGADSLQVQGAPADTAEVDSTRVAFLWAVNNVRLYRDDIQLACDSLAYSDLDSLVRIYRDPIIYNEKGTRQYTADSIYVIIKDQEVKKANLMANAFIATQEDSLLFDQIKGAEVVAYFDQDQTLERFDALGGAMALFFLEENDAFATVNRVESKMLYAQFKDGDLERVHYFESAKNDAYPIVQVLPENRIMKGFNWQPEKRPKGRTDVTSLVPRKSQRRIYESRPQAQFKFTENYFPGYMGKIRAEIAKKDSLAAARDRERRLRERERELLAAQEAADSLARADSLALRDSLALSDSLAVRDSLALSDAPSPAGSPADESPAAVDTLAGFLPAVPADSLAGSRPVSPPDTAAVSAPMVRDSAAAVKPQNPPKTEKAPVTPEELKALEAKKKAEEKAAEQARKKEEAARKQAEKEAKMAEKAARKQEKQEALEAKWAEEDRIYEEKQAAKKQKEVDKRRARKLKQLRRRAEKADRERNLLRKYIERYREEKARKN